jgi:hypothetical protein
MLSVYLLVKASLIRGDLAEAQAELARANQRAHCSPDLRVKSKLMSTRATVQMYLGEFSSAHALFEQSALFSGEAGDGHTCEHWPMRSFQYTV